MHVIYSEETCKRWGNKAGDGEEAEQEWAQVKAHLGLITGGSGRSINALYIYSKGKMSESDKRQERMDTQWQETVWSL